MLLSRACLLHRFVPRKQLTLAIIMLIGFWCDSDITLLCGLHKPLVTVLYFSIINVLCGAGGDASFAPQANLVSNVLIIMQGHYV